MIKSFLLLFNLLVASTIYSVFTDGVAVQIKSPSSVKPGTEFVVDVKINKGDISGFAKFQQELPLGFKASALETKGGTFSFKDQKVKLIWMSLPAEDKIEISYKIVVDDIVTGEKSLGGTFSYIENNERKSYQVEPVTVVVGDEITANKKEETEETNNEEPQQDKEEEQEVAATTESTDNEESNEYSSSTNVSCARTIPDLTKTPTSFIVELSIIKNGLGGFAKIQEELPPGLTASEFETKGAIFSFVNQNAKFLWMSLPEDEEFKIAYKVSVDDPSAVKEIEIRGLFSYLEDGESKKYIILPTSVNLGDGEVVAMKENKTEETIEKIEEPPVQITKKEDQKTPVSKSYTPKSSVRNGKGITYRVQIAAVRKFVETTYFERNNSITDEIYTEMHEGWHKYTTGTFQQYQGARDHRNYVRDNFTIIGPWVTCYNNGDRITVQEALMVSGQKWYR